jgi:hypothetical protein
MALRVFIPMPQGGSRKGGTFGAWFSELAKKELGYKGFDKQLWVQDFYLKYSAWAWDILRIN